MAKKVSKVHVGTSGWYYDHWKQVFYPEEWAKHKWLSYYCQMFDTVEINRSFYRQLTPETVESWYKQAPKKFLYTIKAHRFITHIKRLKDCEEPIGRFYESIEGLREKLGTVLFQLPPSMHKNIEVLKSFVSILPRSGPVIFEFRHISWFDDEVYEVLDDKDLGLCCHDWAGMPYPRLVTGSVLYVRLHGPAKRSLPCYTSQDLKDWAKWIKLNLKKASEAYVYFNNDAEGFAVKNAMEIREILG